MEAPWYCYCLVSSGGATYIGATVDVDRRLRQHRGEIVGGARATRAKVAAGETWRRHCYVGPFTKHDALSFEWHWKHVSKKQRGGALELRIAALNILLADRTARTWNVQERGLQPLCVVVEDQNSQGLGVPADGPVGNSVLTGAEPLGPVAP